MLSPQQPWAQLLSLLLAEHPVFPGRRGELLGPPAPARPSLWVPTTVPPSGFQVQPRAGPCHVLPYPQDHPYLSLRDVSTVGCPLGKGWWERGGETLGGLANEVAVAAVLARSSPSCLPLSSAGCPGAPSPFHSWGRSVGHTAAAGERGWLGAQQGLCLIQGLVKAVGLGAGWGIAHLAGGPEEALRLG